MDYKPEKVFSKEQWEAICAADASFEMFKAASNWQDGSDMAKVYFADSPFSEIMSGVQRDGKGQTPNWRMLQRKCWELYRTFGPVSAAINSKADYTAGSGFGVWSPDLDIRQALEDIVYSFRNKLYATVNGWSVRMMAEGELFILFAFDNDGKVTIRLLEPDRIGKGTANDGLVTNPGDVTQTLFYEHFYNKTGQSEFIPDINIAFNPELAALATDVQGFDIRKTKKSRATGGKFRSVGGYRRFVHHWKNMTGIQEYRRDVSVITTVLEAIHLYWNAIKWQLDHKKAQCAYTNVVGFEDSPQGRIAFGLWKSMTDEERKATGLMGGLTPGSTVFLLPGMTFDVKAPQLTKLEGENQDLLNIAGSGMKSPQDMFQGQSGTASYASLRASRSPLEMEINNMQGKLKNFFKYEVLRVCFTVMSAVGGFPTAFDKEEVARFRGGQPEFKTIKVEPIQLVDLTFPEISFEERIDGRATAYLGSKHMGLRSLGISDNRIAEEMGVRDLDRQRALRALEERMYGKKESVLKEAAANPANPAPDKTTKPKTEGI